MDLLFLLALVFFILVVKAKFGELSKNQSSKKLYDYRKKEYVMTRTESIFFKKLEQAVDGKYHIFPQVHLSSIVDHSVKGQSWKGALSHIQRKSVDFILCDKDYCKTVLAIELDDYTHDIVDRKDRDTEVERILLQAKLPLLRFANGSEDVETIKNKLFSSIGVPI